MGPLRAHGFRRFIHFVELRVVLAELAAAGLEAVSVFTLAGRPVDLHGAETGTHYFHVVARHHGTQAGGAPPSGG